MIESKLSIGLAIRNIAALLMTHIIPCVMLMFIFDALYRLDSFIKAMAAYDVMVSFSAMFVVLLIMGIGFAVVALGITMLIWPLREKWLKVVRWFSFVFVVLIVSRAALHWLLKVSGNQEIWVIGEWVRSVLGFSVLPAMILTCFYVLAVTVTIFWLLKTRRWKTILKEFESIGKGFTKAIALIAVIPAVICGYHLVTVGRTNEFPVCNNSSQALSNMSALKNNKNTLPDIVLVTFDALTAKDMSLYGYHLSTTPAMEQVAKESFVYEQAVSVSNWTKPGTVSMLTGQYPHRHGLFSSLTDAIVLQHPERTLPNLLRKMGYRTTAVVSNASYGHPMSNGTHRSFDICAWDAFAPGFLDGNIFRWLRHNVRNTVGVALLDHNIYISGWLDDLLNTFPAFRLWQRGVLWNEKSVAPPERTFAVAQQAMMEKSTQPKFIWAHVYTPHFPYLPDVKYRGRFLPGNEFTTSRSQEKIPVMYPKDLQPEIDRIRLRYNEYILNSDQAFGDFIGFLKKNGRWENTLLIVSSDHGDSFEDGISHHQGEHLYQQLIHIPLMIRLPGQNYGQRIDAAASQVDIAPTVLNYLKMPIPSWMDGESLGLGAAEQKTYRYSMQLEVNGIHLPMRKGILTATDGRYKLIYSLTHDSLELFDLKIDPNESRNIAFENSALVQKLRTAVVNEISNKLE